MKRMESNRRYLIRKSCLGLGAVLVTGCRTTSPSATHAVEEFDPKANAAGHPLHTRQRWSSDLDSDTKKKYQTAVAWFKANDKQKFPASDPRSYLTWKKLASAHALSCQHMSWLFLPWHRLFLNYFETACRYALKDGSFSLPYWDWTKDPTIPSEFFAADFPEFRAKRNLHSSSRIAEEFVGARTIERLLEIDDFFAFHSGPSPSTFIASHMMAGNVEGTCHNAVHNMIGGDMLRLAAPEDPLFWLHHANIDRLWASWARLHPGATTPNRKLTTGPRDRALAASEWLDSMVELKFLDPSAPGKSRVLPDIPGSEFHEGARGRRRVKELLTTELNLYSYDDLVDGPTTKLSDKAHDEAFSKRNEILIDGISRVEREVLLSNMTLNAELLGKLRALKEGGHHASLLALNVPVLPDAVISNRMILRFFVYPAGELTREYRDQLRTPSAIERNDYLGSYTFLVQGHLTHDQVSKGTININIDITHWLRQAQPFQNLTILGIAIDPAKQNSVIDLFPDVETELKIQFSAE